VNLQPEVKAFRAHLPLHDAQRAVERSCLLVPEDEASPGTKMACGYLDGAEKCRGMPQTFLSALAKAPLITF